jgi:hypothetical protein
MVKDEHKDWKLDKKDLELEFARNSLIEELEAVNNYKARLELTENKGLKKILQHNMDEEKEHAAMLVEWIRKNDETQDKVFKEHD